MKGQGEQRIPDSPGKSALERGVGWFHAAGYELALDDGVPVVRPVAGANVEWYNPWPAEESAKRSVKQPVKPLAKQPHRPKDHRWSPHTHLAHLDPSREEEALEFYNRWGPLGLWTLPTYRDRRPFTAEGVPAPKRPMEEGLLAPAIAGWFRPPDAGRDALAHQEPLEFFEDAAERYQDWLGRLERAKTDRDAATSAAWEAAAMLTDCRPLLWSPWQQEDGRWQKGERWTLAWSFPSLLSFCYLRTVLDLVQEGLGFRQCANRRCGRFFLPSHPRQVYCSVLCHNCENVRRSYNKKRAARERASTATGETTI